MNRIRFSGYVTLLWVLPMSASADPCSKSSADIKAVMAELAKADSNPSQAKSMAKTVQKTLAACQKANARKNARAQKAIKLLESKDQVATAKNGSDGLTPDQEKKAKAAKRRVDTAKKEADTQCTAARKAVNARDTAAQSLTKANEMVAAQKPGWNNWVAVANQLQKKTKRTQIEMRSALVKCNQALKAYAEADTTWEGIYGR